MFDLMHTTPHTTSQNEVLFLSNPLGVAREWQGLADTIGTLAPSRMFDRTGAFQNAARFSHAGAHLVAHGSAAHHVIQAAIQHPGEVRSITLIDPDILASLPDLHDCPSYRQNLRINAKATALVDQGRTSEAAQCVINWWMGRSAWSNTSNRLRSRFAAAIPALIADWRSQARSPLCLLGLASVPCPIQIVIGRHAPADIRALTQVMRLALPQTSRLKIHGAHGASHLTHPHIVGPALRKFVVCNDAGWHTELQRHAA